MYSVGIYVFRLNNVYIIQYKSIYTQLYKERVPIFMKVEIVDKKEVALMDNGSAKVTLVQTWLPLIKAADQDGKILTDILNEQLVTDEKGKFHILLSVD